MSLYKGVIDWLYEQIPPYQFRGGDSYKPGLSRIKNFMNALGNPESELKFIHVGGTNGKGSTSNIISSILQEYGKKVGLFTSPHILEFRERIKVDSNEVNKQFVIDFVNTNKDYFLSNKNSFFEISFAMAISYFKLQKVDYAVIEVGLGGRLDATNIIKPLLSVITNIGYDHTKFLGNKITSIAYEKSGIIKKNIPVLIGEKNQETDNVFIEKAKNQSSKIFFAEDFLSLAPVPEFVVNFQKKNINTALAAMQILFENKISPKILRKGILNIFKSTSFRGRWEKISDKPLVIADVAHNIEGFSEIIKEIYKIKCKKRIFIFGFVKDKPIEEILKLFPRDGIYLFSTPKISRGLSLEELNFVLRNLDINYKVFDTLQNAYKEAIKIASKDDFVFIGGSNFTLSELIDFF